MQKQIIEWLGRMALLMMNGREVDGKDIQVDANEISWVSEEGKKLTERSNVAKIVFKNRSRGFLQGMGLGAAVGSGTVVGLSLLPGQKVGSPDWWFGVLLGGAIFTGVGIVAGGIIGSIVGHRDEYVIPSAVTLEKIFTVVLKSGVRWTGELGSRGDALLIVAQNNAIAVPLSEVTRIEGKELTFDFSSLDMEGRRRLMQKIIEARVKQQVFSI